MAEDCQQRSEVLPPCPTTRPQPGLDGTFGVHLQQPIPSQISKEKLYQQRQKCELRRLLKHTHPELKKLDDAVDDELAEVLSLETGATTGETGYEGEVLSRRLIFEKCSVTDGVSSYTPKRHMAEGPPERGDVSRTAAVFEEERERERKERPWSVEGITDDDKMLGAHTDSHTEGEEEMVRIDVQATRRMFECQSVDPSRLRPDNRNQRKTFILGDVTTSVGTQRQEGIKENPQIQTKSKACTRSFDLTDLHQVAPVIGQSNDHEFFKEQFPTDETDFKDEVPSLPDTGRSEEVIKTSAALLNNNPFIQTNIEKEDSFVHRSKSQSPVGAGEAAQDYPIANVKNRAHLFESMPFDKIRQQNQDEVETMVENIKETLNSLHRVNAICSDGSIIEVNETMIAKRAKFTLSESGPIINYDKVAEGGAQNFIVHLLPRMNLKPHITYLKEDSKGNVDVTVVNVPVHQHQFTTNQDSEFKTANMVQVVEDILNQDNSLRKGVIIQEDVDRCPKVSVYSLYNYFDEEDVKSYCPPQGADCNEPQPVGGDASEQDHQEPRKGAIESTINCLLGTSKDQTCQGSIRPEITEKGNVKLFKNCIEKGDLEYLKSLQPESVLEQELPTNQTELNHEERGDQSEESTAEWIPVDIKRLKNMFSGDTKPIQPKQPVWAQSTPTPCAFAGKNVPLSKNRSSTESNVGIPVHLKSTSWEAGTQTQKEACNPHLETQDDSRVHRAELINVVDDADEICNLQTAIKSLQQATLEAKSLHQSLQEKKKCVVQESGDPIVPVTTGKDKHPKTEAELLQEKYDQKEGLTTKSGCNEIPSASNIPSEHKSDQNIEITKDSNSESVETCNKKSHKGTEMNEKSAVASVHESQTTEDEEIVFQGKLQAALNSLERSNINVTRGDFRAAMIYRNSSKPHKENSHSIVAVSVENPTRDEFCPVAESKSTQAQLKRQEAPEEQVTTANANPKNQTENLGKTALSVALKRDGKPVGPKPTVPPKPEHLKAKQRDIHSAKAKNPKHDTVETIPQTPSASDENEHKQDKINRNANSGPGLADTQKNYLAGETVPMTQQTAVEHQVQGTAIIPDDYSADRKVNAIQQDIKDTAEGTSTQDFSAQENQDETDKCLVDSNESCKKFENKKTLSTKNAPVKPKRVKITQPDNKKPKHMSVHNRQMVDEPQPNPTVNSDTCGQTADSSVKPEKEMKGESKVEMREKKVRHETEDERRQRLSVHMDEIMRGNITAAMEIFDNLRKQEELQSILSRVEEIEQDTSEVDVRSLKRVFENVPDWVVSPDKKQRQKQVKAENKEERMTPVRDNTESKSSMALVFGDLERASEEIMNLKEQTLARLMDIEGAIKKALYSVSTLKSDSDIAGLSCLFKESLGTSPSSGNISKISIGSSKTKSAQTLQRQGNTALPVTQNSSVEVAKQRASPPSSPAFISIQSAARKTDKTEAFPPEPMICPTCQHSPKTEDKFTTTKILTRNSPAQNKKRDPRKGGQKQSAHNQFNPKRELSVLEVQTDHEGNSISGTKTVTENYERTDNFGNRFYSSKTSTVITAQPETTTSTGQAAVKYPEVLLPINQNP